MRPGKYVVRKIAVTDGSEVVIPPKAREVQLTEGVSLEITWLERVSCKENKNLDIVDAIMTAFLVAGGSLMFWATGIALLGGVL